MILRPAVTVIGLAAVVALAGCTPAHDPVATFQVVDEQYKIELATPELVAHAEALLARGRMSRAFRSAPSCATTPA